MAFKMALRAQVEELSATNTQGQSVSLNAPSIGPSMYIGAGNGFLEYTSAKYLEPTIQSEQ